MTDKELRKLSRAELLTLLIEVTEENERLTGILERRGVQDADGAAGGVPEGVTEDVQGVFHSLESTAVGFLKEARGISDQIILEAQERADEIIADYMVSYENYYGLEPGTEKYDMVISKNIMLMLPIIAGTDDLESVDLAAATEAYLLKHGMDPDSLAALKDKLSRA